jgi:hypothetical protein
VFKVARYKPLSFVDIVENFQVPKELENAPATIKDYLIYLAMYGNEAAAVRMSGITTADIRFWRQNNSAFRMAEQEALNFYADALEIEAQNRVLSDPSDKRDKLLLAMLKAAKPDKYGDKINISGEGVQIVLPSFLSGAEDTTDE